MKLSQKKRNKADEGPVGDLQITFSSGLTGSNAAKTSVFENEPEIEETTVEKYVRKERERKQKRKENMKNVGNGPVSTIGEKKTVGKTSEKPSEDLGFDDPFFAAPEHDKASAAKMRKEERSKKRAEREAEEAAAASKRAELELLMVDDNDDGKGMRHFDMKEIEREERRSKKKKGKKGKSKNEVKSGPKSQDAGFKMDTQDPRFSRLFDNHEFAIDPTNPKFKGTEGMRALLEEGRKHQKRDRGLEDQETAKTSKELASTSKHEVDDVRNLVEKVKSKKRV